VDLHSYLMGVVIRVYSFKLGRGLVNAVQPHKENNDVILTADTIPVVYEVTDGAPKLEKEKLRRLLLSGSDGE